MTPSADRKDAPPLRSLKAFAVIAAAVWTVLVLGDMTRDLREERNQILSMAREEAATIASMDMSFRNWVIDHGGVYVRDSPEAASKKAGATPANPGLVLLSHARAMQQIYESRAQQGQIFGHISSLYYRNPDQAPDDWERAALTDFEHGKREAVTKLEGKRLRFIRPFPLEEKCLACHAREGRPLGTPLGGITNEVPLEPLEATGRVERISTIIGHLVIWSLGLLGIGFGCTRLGRALSSLRASEELHRSLFDSSRDALMTLAPPTWVFTSGNPATVAMFKARDEADFTSHGPWQLSPERQPDGRTSADKAREMIETAMRTGSHFFPWTHKRLDEEEFPAEVLLTRMSSSGETFLQATVRDITARRLAEAERDSLIGKLQDSLAHVKTLSGFIPICASCKKIRNDKGFWESVEKYVTQHSEAQFSHGVCPDCGKKLYGDLYQPEPPK